MKAGIKKIALYDKKIGADKPMKDAKKYKRKVKFRMLKKYLMDRRKKDE